MDSLNYSSSSDEEKSENNMEHTLLAGSVQAKAEESFIAHKKTMDCEDSGEERPGSSGKIGSTRQRFSPLKNDKEKRSQDHYEDKYRAKAKYDKKYEYSSKDRDVERYKNRDKRSDRYYKDNKYRDDSRKSDRYYKDYREKDDKYRSYRHESKESRRERRHKSKSKERTKEKKRSLSKSPPPAIKKIEIERKEAQVQSISPVRNSSSTSGTSGDEQPIKAPITTFLPLAAPPPLVNRTLLPKAPGGPAVELPSYYNPNVINVNKYAEQVQKRKLLWSGKKEEAASSASKWNNAKFSQDNDGKVNAKFMRLMGIKNATTPEESNTKAETPKSSEDMFNKMEHQYEVARAVTHSYRGVGLGFAKPF